MRVLMESVQIGRKHGIDEQKNKSTCYTNRIRNPTELNYSKRWRISFVKYSHPMTSLAIQTCLKKDISG